METGHVQALPKIGALKMFWQTCYHRHRVQALPKTEALKMRYSERLEIFEKVRVQYSPFLVSVLWKLTGDRELFAEAMQYTLLGMWQHADKLAGRKAGAYIYRIALTANARAWRDRAGSNGHFTQSRIDIDADPGEKLGRVELTAKVRKAISRLPDKQGRAIVMRYLEHQDYEAIAGTLRCTQAGARSHVSKALAALKDKLAALAQQE
jgi:RNA polymerase sigma factor (sigma-70 family)